MLKKAARIVPVILVVIFVAVAFLYFDSDIGVPQSKIESDARSSQQIADWLVEKDSSDTMAALIFYPEDKSDHTFSIYVNRPGLSFGYFFRGGGDIAGTGNDVVEVTVEGYNERAFVSMNEQKVERLEIDDGNSVQVTEIDSSKPFALIVPGNAGSIAFYDTNGNVVETHEEAL